MADMAELETALRNADAAGDAEAAQVLAAHIVKLRGVPAATAARPAFGMERSPSAEFLSQLPPTEGAFASFGESARQTLRTVRNKLLPNAQGALAKVIGPGGEADTVKNAAELEPLFKKHPLAAALGGAAITVPAAALGGSTIPGMMAGAGLVGAATSEPGKELEAGVKDAATAGVIGGILKGAGAFFRGATPRANRTSLRIMEPDANAVVKAEDAFGTYEKAGQAIHDLGLDKPGMDLRARRDALRAIGQQAGVDIDSVLTEAELQGAKVDVPALVQRMVDKAKMIVAKPGAEGLTPTLRSSRADIIDQVNSFANHPQISTGNVRALENAKRALADEGYLQGQQKYPNLVEARKDPASAWYKRASGEVKDAVEQAVGNVDPKLLERFLEAKGRSGVAQSFEPTLTRAAAGELAASSGSPLPNTVWSAKSGATHTLLDPVLRQVAPYWQMLNRGAGAVESATPRSLGPVSYKLDRDITQALVEYLRSHPQEN